MSPHLGCTVLDHKVSPTRCVKTVTQKCSVPAPWRRIQGKGGNIFLTPGPGTCLKADDTYNYLSRKVRSELSFEGETIRFTFHVRVLLQIYY